MIVLTKKDLDVQEPGHSPWEGPYIPSAIRQKLGPSYIGPIKEQALNPDSMSETEPIPQSTEKQAIGRAVPVAWLLFQLSKCVAKGEWAIRMAADNDGGIWIEGDSWNNDWPKIGTEP